MGRESTNAWYKSSNTLWINTGKDHLASVCDHDRNMSIPYYYHFITSYSSTSQVNGNRCGMSLREPYYCCLWHQWGVHSHLFPESKEPTAEIVHCFHVLGHDLVLGGPNLRHLFLPLSPFPAPSCSTFSSSKQQCWLHLLCTTNFDQEVCKYLILKTALLLCCFCFVKGYFYSLHLQHIIHSSFCLEGKGYLYLILDITVSLYTVHICTNKLIKC